MIDYYAYVAKKRKITEEETTQLANRNLFHGELWVVQTMEREELLGLMKYCGIRVYNEMPVIACTEEELRLAYITWRSHHIRTKRNKMKKWSNLIHNSLKSIREYKEIKELL